ncbi:MAG: mannitol dehydrogenase family protein [Moraxellaceae bacterium]|nr:mannitol dehydrogenase family protein [Moraxellaceae bacterium]
MRLSASTLSHARPTVLRPAYDRLALQHGIVHLGLGAFHRAHQAWYTEQVLQGGDLRWGIVGASLNSTATRDALVPQDGLYTLAIQQGEEESLRVIGALGSVLGGAADLPALMQHLCARGTRIVSLTLTEKGYYLDAASGSLRLDAPEIAADLASPHSPRTAPGLIVEALRQRRAQGLMPFTVLSCDNLSANGDRTRDAVLAYARVAAPTLVDWIAAEVAFPNSMVDRITPATTDAERARIAAQTGLDDAWPVVTERFSQWVVEDRFPQGRPQWEIAGVVFSDDIHAWETMKLRCLNGAHSTIAYLGQLAGHETVADTMADPRIAEKVNGLWNEIVPTLKVPQGADPTAYIDSLRSRFANTALRHRTAQIAMDGSQKLPPRLLAPLRQRLAAGQPSPSLEGAVAAWMAFVARAATRAETLNDPLAPRITEAARGTSGVERVRSLLGIREIFSEDLLQSAALVERLSTAVQGIERDAA